VTARVVVAEVLPYWAVMVTVPAPTAVARPLLFTVATDVLDELQVTCPVRLKVDPSENVPVAVSCVLTPAGMLELADVTAIDERVAEVTVRVAVPVVVPIVAVMVTVPASTAVARPLSTIATSVLDELQVACVVTSPVLPSAFVPVAKNCCVPAMLMTAVVGVTAMELGGCGPHPGRHAANDTGKNTAQNNLKVFMSILCFPP